MNGAIPSPARAAYHRAFARPEGIQGACEDYRAGATIDLEHDRAASPHTSRGRIGMRHALASQSSRSDG